MTPLLPWLVTMHRQVLDHHRGHALLLHGPAGLGHYQLAAHLAAAWLCEGDRAVAPCGQCAACRLVDAHTHPDLKLLVPEELALRMGLNAADDAAEGAADGEGKSSKKKPGRDIKVDAIRAAIAWAATTPSRGRAKVIVLHPAHAMNATAASALLKTLEEPAASVRLVLTTTDPDLLLPTIRSRCQKLRMVAPDARTSLHWLAEQGVVEPAVVLAAAGGRPLEARDLAADRLDAVFWGQVARAVAQGDAGLFVGLPLPRAIESMQKVCHDAMAVAVGAMPRYLPAAAIPAGAELAALAGWSRELVRASRHDDHPVNAPLLVESLVAQGHGAWKKPRSRPGDKPPPPATRSLHSAA